MRLEKFLLMANTCEYFKFHPCYTSVYKYVFSYNNQELGERQEEVENVDAEENKQEAKPLPKKPGRRGKGSKAKSAAAKHLFKDEVQDVFQRKLLNCTVRHNEQSSFDDPGGERWL